MKKREKVLIIIGVLITLVFFTGITYSFFHSNANLNSNNQNIAKFVFNAESLDHLDLPLTSLNPGDNEEYAFSVSNNESGNISNVSVEYQMIIKTYHLVPLVIQLYKIDGENEVLILTCDESYTRNLQNELICNTPTQEMGHSSELLDNYKLKVEFPIEYNDEEYSNLVDFINIEIKSWQNLED